MDNFEHKVKSNRLLCIFMNTVHAVINEANKRKKLTKVDIIHTVRTPPSNRGDGDLQKSQEGGWRFFFKRGMPKKRGG